MSLWKMKKKMERFMTMILNLEKIDGESSENFHVDGKEKQTVISL